jgi:hypothetical protein
MSSEANVVVSSTQSPPLASKVLLDDEPDAQHPKDSELEATNVQVVDDKDVSIVCFRYISFFALSDSLAIECRMPFTTHQQLLLKMLKNWNLPRKLSLLPFVTNAPFEYPFCHTDSLKGH